MSVAIQDNDKRPSFLHKILVFSSPGVYLELLVPLRIYGEFRIIPNYMAAHRSCFPDEALIFGCELRIFSRNPRGGY